MKKRIYQQDVIRHHLEILYKEQAGSVLRDMLALLEGWQEKAGCVQKDWVSEKDVMLITYGDSIRKNGEAPLAALRRFLNRFMKDTVTAVHILPMFPYTSDDGFSVVDYYQIDDRLGTWEDVRALAGDYDMMYDAVVNHVSKAGSWFQHFLACDPDYKAYFITADPDGDYSMVIRPRALPLLTPFETIEGLRHVWTTFSDDQVDLNFQNPKVLLEILQVLLTYADRGARFIRLDAIGFAWKKKGTTCMHLEETHAVVKLMRAAVEQVFPGTILITETNVPHIDNISYFGDGSDEAQMVYQFPLPPLTLFSFLSGNAAKLTEWAESLGDTPLEEGTTYYNFLASHDGIGMRPTEGILTEHEKQMMVDTVIRHGGRINYKFNCDGTKSPYELNINYMDALTDPQSPDMKERVGKFVAAQAILLSVAGVPGIYMHSLIGSQNWYAGVEESGINRRINREKLDYDQVSTELEAEGSLRNQVFDRLSQLIRLRRQQSAFSPAAAQQVVRLDERAFAFIRHNRDTGEKMLTAVNVSGETYDIPAAVKGFDLVNNEAVDIGNVKMLPYQVRWIKYDSIGPL